MSQESRAVELLESKEYQEYEAEQEKFISNMEDCGAIDDKYSEENLLEIS